MKLRTLVMIPVMTALVAALGILPPIAVPFLPGPSITAQTLGVMLAGIVLGAWGGAASQLVFIMLVAFGAPLLAGGRGGLAVVVGPTAGYLWAWPVAAWLIGYLTDRTRVLTAPKLFSYSVLGGILVIYAGGIPVYSLVTGTPLVVAAVGNWVFVPGDLLKAGAAAAVGLAVRRALETARVGRFAHTGD